MDFMAKTIGLQTVGLEAGTQKTIDISVHDEFGRLRLAVVNAGGALRSYNASIKITERLSADDAKRITEEELHHPEAGKWKTLPTRKQIGGFIDLLRKEGVGLLFVDDVKDAFVQFFTRDIGFVVGNTFYVGRRTDAYREIELIGLMPLLPSMQKVVFLGGLGRIEGGDVMPNGSTVYVGLGGRTDRDGLDAFRRFAERDEFEIVPVPLKDWVLHLDCRFNILSSKLAVAYPKDIEPQAMKLLDSRFEIIPVNSDELKTLAPNFLVIGEKTVVGDVRNTRLNDILRLRGFRVLELPYDEVTKIWGAYRCSVLPLIRG
jgi:N-dimethylarginine dimethylaminohydrolase